MAEPLKDNRSFCHPPLSFWHFCAVVPAACSFPPKFASAAVMLLHSHLVCRKQQFRPLLGSFSSATKTASRLHKRTVRDSKLPVAEFSARQGLGLTWKAPLPMTVPMHAQRFRGALPRGDAPNVKRVTEQTDYKIWMGPLDLEVPASGGEWSISGGWAVGWRAAMG